MDEFKAMLDGLSTKILSPSIPQRLSVRRMDPLPGSKFVEETIRGTASEVAFFLASLWLTVMSLIIPEQGRNLAHE